MLVKGVSPHRPKFDACAFNVGFIVKKATKRHVFPVLEFSPNDPYSYSFIVYPVYSR
jgi:hypothetical protein